MNSGLRGSVKVPAGMRALRSHGVKFFLSFIHTFSDREPGARQGSRPMALATNDAYRRNCRRRRPLIPPKFTCTIAQKCRATEKPPRRRAFRLLSGVLSG